jgi:hypothetical protein
MVDQSTGIHVLQVHYVRPRCNKHDLELWRDGLCGMNNNLLLISSLTAPSITSNEAHWMGVDRRIRLAAWIIASSDSSSILLPAWSNVAGPWGTWTCIIDTYRRSCRLCLV